MLPFCAALLLLLAGCGATGGDGTYPASVERNFMRGCQAMGANHGYCSCALIYLEKTVSLADFEIYESGESGDTGPVPVAIAAAGSACAWHEAASGHAALAGSLNVLSGTRVG